MSTLLRRLAALEKQLGPPQDTSREDFSKTPEAVAWRLIAESERRLILDLFEGREDGYEPEAVTLQSATPEQAAAHARYQRFVHIHKELDRAAERFQKLRADVSRDDFDPEVRKAARTFQDLSRVKQHYLDREEPHDYLRDRLAKQGFDVPSTIMGSHPGC